MFQIETAGLVIRIYNRFEDVEYLCRDYMTPDSRKADISVAVSEEDLQRQVLKFKGIPVDVGYAECVALYGEICNALPAYDAFVMHSSVVEVDGAPYAGVTNIGVKPTVGSDRVLSETWIQSYEGDLYGCRMAVGLRAFLRPERKFASLAELKAEIERDARRALALVEMEISGK